MTVTGSMAHYGQDRWRVRATVGIDPTTGKEKRLSEVVDADWSREGEELARRAKYRLIESAEQIRRDWENAPEAMTMAEACRRWWEWKHRKLAGATVESYSIAMDRVLDGMGEMLVARIGAVDIDRFYMRLQDQGVNPPSIVKIHIVVSGALGLAAKWGAIPINPATLTSAPTVEEREIDPPDPLALATSLVRLLEDHPEMGAFALSAAGTGIRPGEQCGLRWSDITVDEVEIDGKAIRIGDAHIQRAVAKDGKGGWTIAKTKTRMKRHVALGVRVVELLDIIRARQIEQCEAVGAPFNPDGYVFTRDATQAADHTHPRLWGQRWSKRQPGRQSMREEYGLPGVRLYDLRHFAATHMVADGHDPVTIARMLGHNPSMLLSRYAHPISANARAAAAGLERKLVAPAS